MLTEDEVRTLSSCITIIPILAASMQKMSLHAGSAQLPLPRTLRGMAVGAGRGWRAALQAHTALVA